MIKIKKVAFTNFLSYGAVPTEVNFETPGTTIMVGKNGVGKTSIINALVYGLYDKPISQGINKDDLVNNINKRRMKVEVEFDIDDIPYKVVRARKMKPGPTGNYVKIFEGKKDITPDSIYNANSLLIEIIGIDYELFVRIVTFAATHEPFLDLPVHSGQKANQTDIIEELFDLKTLSDKADLLKERIKDNERSLKTAEREVEFKKKERITYNDQIRSAELRIERWKENTSDDIDDIAEKIKTAEEVDIDTQRNLQDELRRIEGLLIQNKSIKTSTEKELMIKNKEDKKITKELEHLSDDECPYCLQKYPDADEKIEELTKQQSKLEKEIVKLKSSTDKCIKHINTDEKDKKTIKDKIVIDDIEELMETKTNLYILKSKLKELTTTTNPHLDALIELQAKKPPHINMKKINQINEDIDHQKFLHKILTKKDSFVRKALLDRNIPYLNKQLAFYLNELGLPFAVEFTHEMTAKITSFGNEISFANMSAGQKSRINLALSFAFRDVLQNLHSKINVCVMDEVLDVGLDVEGVQIATTMLKNRAISENLSMFVVSHKSDEIDAFEKRMVIEMKDGFSSITYE